MRIPFTNVLLTRDHVLFFWGKLLGLCALIPAGLFDPNLGGVDPSLVGLTPACVHRIQAIAGLITTLSFWLGMSPLPLSHHHPLSTIDSGVVLSPFNSNKPIN